MRLREILETLKIVKESCNIIRTNTTLYDVPIFVDAIENIYGLFPPIDKHINELKKFPSIYNYRMTEVMTTTSTANSFMESYYKLIDTIDTMIEVIPICLNEEKENTIYVKLPNFTSLTELANFTKTLDTTLNQIVTHSEIGGQVILNNFDSGSLWFEICLYSSSAVTLVASTLWSAAVVRKKVLECKLMEEKVRAYQLGNDAVEKLKEGMTNEINELCRAEAKNIMSLYNLTDTDNEYESRLMYSIKEFSELINKNTEIHASYLENEDVSNLFPDFKHLDNVTSKIKQIEEKK